MKPATSATVCFLIASVFFVYWRFPSHTVYVDRKVYVLSPEMMPDALMSDRPCSFQKFLDGHVTVTGCDFSH